MTRRLSRFLLVVTACAAALLLAEAIGRLLLRPDARGSGALFGVVLPPLRLFPPEEPTGSGREAPYGGLVVEGRAVTVGDVAGYHRYDARLGYTTQENAASVNGWWHANEIGARETTPTPTAVTAGQTRWLLLGESFAHGSGLPDAQGWAAVAEARDPTLDIVNLAVDGYSMAQSYLRYESYAAVLEHQGVLLMFVPGVDLWRDINVVRDLGEAWKVRAVMPRFVLDGPGIRLVPSFYASPEALDADNRPGPGATLREHLRRYDRFYFAFEQEPPPLVGELVVYRIAAAAWGRAARGRLRRAQFRPDSEALETSRRIFLKLQDDVRAYACPMVLLVQPTATDLERLREEPAFAREWQALVDFSCRGLRHCVDLMPVLAALPVDAIDLAPDGHHFGPRTNAAIADAVREVLPLRQPMPLR